jgi:hypothetical protein
LQLVELDAAGTVEGRAVGQRALGIVKARAAA